jgi:D-alanyl-D-alanine carboxypeptidase
MLRSGNDCAVALALHCKQNIALFAKKMNEVAERAGALSSRFENPHGLPCKNHYTTAYDLALITCYALQNPTFCQIVSTKYYEPKNWYNKNKMLALYDGATGVKTGFTKEAGRCLVSTAKRENMRIVSVVLNSPMMYERSAELLNSAFQTYTMTKLVEEGETLSNGEFFGRSKTEFYYPLCEGEMAHVERRIRQSNDRNNKKIVGQFEIYLTKRLLFSANLYKL